jgi:hypothetical protein
MSAPPNLPRQAGRKVVLLADLGGGVRALIDFGIAISVRRFVSISLPLVMEHRAHRSDSWDGAPTPTGLSAAASPMTPSGCRTPTAPHPGGWRRLPLSSYGAARRDDNRSSSCRPSFWRSGTAYRSSCRSRRSILPEPRRAQACTAIPARTARRVSAPSLRECRHPADQKSRALANPPSALSLGSLRTDTL